MSSSITQEAPTPPALNPSEYLAKRVDDQINWYDVKSLWNQTWFKRLRIAEIVAAALIPFLTAIPAPPGWDMKYIIAGLGVLITVVAGVLALFQFQERWTEYRATCEALKKERFLFLTKSDPYVAGDGFSMFVQKVETLLSKENTNWVQSFVKPEQVNEKAA